jgi:hypothetical protein
VAEKGVGQGDIHSPLLWVAAFDIPLTALALIDGEFKVQDIESQASSCQDIAFADDLVSIVATPEILQSKADIMSSWCLLSNVKMNITKLRTFGILWGAVKGREDKHKIHGEGWTEIVVDINHDGFMTHLGVIWNMDTNNLKQIEYLNERLEEMGSRILRHRGRVGDKILALEYCLRADIVYRMQFCVWGLDAYEKLSTTYTRLVKKITRNLSGYPTVPLWTLTADGGLGLQSLIDFAHKLKLRLLLKNIESNDEALINPSNWPKL